MLPKLDEWPAARLCAAAPGVYKVAFRNYDDQIEWYVVWVRYKKDGTLRGRIDLARLRTEVIIGQ